MNPFDTNEKLWKGNHNNLTSKQLRDLVKPGNDYVRVHAFNNFRKNLREVRTDKKFKLGEHELSLLDSLEEFENKFHEEARSCIHEYIQKKLKPKKEYSSRVIRKDITKDNLVAKLDEYEYQLAKLYQTIIKHANHSDDLVNKYESSTV